MPVRFFALGARACLESRAGGAWCGYPNELRGDGGHALALDFRSVVGLEKLAEAATREACFRTTDGVAVCHGREVARGVKSVAGAPYLLRDDGTVVVVRDRDPAAAGVDALREAAVRKLPPLERLVAAEHATCGLTRSSQVWCWPEPAYPYTMEIQVPVEPRPLRVPGLTDVVDLTLMPWLTLCVRTRAGAVLCSAAPSRATDLCVLLGKSDVRCGPQDTGPRGPPGLAGAGYDPRRIFELALLRVPGLDGADPATTLSAYARLAYQNRESERRIYVSDLDEGGCARLASGAVRCWERDPCATRTPWRSSLVEGLPRGLARVALGANDGYGLTGEGALYTWARRSPRGRPTDDCTKASAFALSAERVALREPAVDIAGGTFVIEAEPMFAGVDCVTLASGKITCWRTDETRKAPIDATLAE